MLATSSPLDHDTPICGKCVHLRAPRTAGPATFQCARAQTRAFVDLVTGIEDVTGDLLDCYAQRADPAACGPDGRHFVGQIQHALKALDGAFGA